jgi:hypothetical protein
MVLVRGKWTLKAERERGVMRLTLVLNFIFAALVTTGCGSRPGSIEGRAVSRGAAVAGATVEIYLSGERGREATPFATAATGGDGAFRLELPEGRYWVWVKDLAGTEGPRRLAEYPDNPVQIAGGRTRGLGDIELRAASRTQESVAAPGTGIRGRILHAGEPAVETTVMVYEAGSTRLTGPGYLALARTDAAGRFQIDLAPGAYRFAARRRRSGAASGYLQEGDSSATVPQDPIVVPPDGYLELGDLTLHEVDAGRLAAAGSPGLKEAAAIRLEGLVVGRDGKPRPSQFVFVYRDEGMIGRPEAMARTDATGGFSLSLPEGGKYYVGARNRHGGPRQPGEWAGKLAGRPDSGLEVLSGRKVKGLTIVMEQVW